MLVLGCDGSWPGPGGACSGYLVSTPSTTLWLDAGPGTFANLQRFADPADIDAVVLSHRHPDHWTDLYGFETYLAHGAVGADPVPVLAPADVCDGTGLASSAVLDFETVGDGDVRMLRDIRLTFSRTDHGPETLAVRIDAGGRSVGYSADSGPGWTLASLGPGLDLALCEASHLADAEGTVRHLSGRQAGALARSAGVGRLVLTHRWPTVDAARVAAEAEATFGRPVEQAAVGEDYTV